MPSKTQTALISLLLAAIGTGVGVLVGHFAISSPQKETSEPKEDLTIQIKLKNAMKSSNIEEHLRYKHDVATVISLLVFKLNLTKF